MNIQKAVIVGGTNGLGRSIAHWLVSRGVSVTVVGRTFRDEETDHLNFLEADLSVVSEQHRIGAELPVEDIGLLVFTVGILSPKLRETSIDGVEIDLAVSYLSRFVILRSVADKLGANLRSRARVFVMGAPGSNIGGNPNDLNSEQSYSQFAAHAQTIAANEALVLDAVARYPEIDVYGLAPGLVATGAIRAPFLGGVNSLRFKIVEWLISKFSHSADEYANRIGPMLIGSALEASSGSIFDSKARRKEPSQKLTPERVSEIIKATEELLRTLPR
ncbi:MAG: SDR family NAD(P)-dependent oxidoreductase [Cyanobacteria bacterium P01_F01_bin.86]